MLHVKTAQIGGRHQASCQGHETPPSRGCPYHIAGIETAEQATWVSPCGGHQRKALFNRGYQPLALLEEVPPLIYRSTSAPQKASPCCTSKRLKSGGDIRHHVRVMRPLQVGDVRITLPGLRPPSKPHGSVLVVATNGIAAMYREASFNRGYQPLELLEEVRPLIYRSTSAPQNASP